MRPGSASTGSPGSVAPPRVRPHAASVATPSAVMNIRRPVRGPLAAMSWVMSRESHRVAQRVDHIAGA